ncbi:MAG: N-acetyl-gamma-glutamyl-phosphate reductase, partial [Pseudomonadota bacterium]|nr:N-acetyl-gamma-glutamyl-phosphate reductase [Pseudomonadota bacterium]
MFNIAVIGASGYTGAQLVNLIVGHPQMTLKHVLVSENSADAGKTMAQVHGNLAHLSQYVLTPLNSDLLVELAATM